MTIAENGSESFTLTGNKEVGFVDDLTPAVVAELSEGALISKAHVEAEIDLILRTIRLFWGMEPDQVMRTISGISARLTELGVHLHRLESRREWRQVRTMQVERALLECDRQFKLASRLLEVRRQDIELSR